VPKSLRFGTGFLLARLRCEHLLTKREDIHAELRAAGARVDESVKKDTTYLVAGDKTGKTKLDQAKKFGARVLTESQMEAVLRGETLAPE